MGKAPKKLTTKQRSNIMKAAWAKRKAAAATFTKRVDENLTIGEYKNPLLNTRERTHGDFRAVADYTNRILAAMNTPDVVTFEPRAAQLSTVQGQALTMVAAKIGRILAGDNNFAEHWDDIAGYANLVSHDLQR